MDTSIVCIACGEVSNRASDRRNLTSQASQHVVPLFTEIFGEECRKQLISIQPSPHCELPSPVMPPPSKRTFLGTRTTAASSSTSASKSPDYVSVLFFVPQ